MNVRNSIQAGQTAILLLLPLITLTCHAADTIFANGSLSGDQTIISAGGMFELGFFTPGNTSNYYIAIWYKKIPGQAIIWIPNRDKPVSDRYSTSLRISNDGNLVLVSNVSRSPIWSTNLNYSNMSESMEAVLLDNGNLVLRGGSNSTPPIWQSFDYPTDTLMPAGKLGLNKKTKWSRVLTSWSNSEDPAPGLYTIERDPNASQFIMLWNQTENYWRSGVWIPEQRIFSLVPELRFLKTQLYSFSYVDNENESYITYDVNSPSIVTRLVMDYSGQLKQLTWLETTKQWVLFWSQPGEQCDVHAYCGVFGTCNQNSLPYCHCLQGFEPNSTSQWNLNDYSGGCARKTKLECESSSSKDKFLASPSMVLPEHPHLVSVSSFKECEMACLGNCSCTAYAYDNKGCLIWVGDLMNMRQLSDTDTSEKTLHLRLAASDLQTSSHKTLVIGILVSLAMGLLVLLLGLFGVVHWRKKRNFLRAAKAMENSLTRFGYRDLQSATKNFSERLGGGGFGSVFKGILPDSTIVAVKKLESIGQTQGEKQFRTEVSAIGTIQHVNLVRLRGFCSEGTQRLLVYDYMPNGSLNTHLFRKEGSQSQILSWKVRYQIAVGVARGLAYLHEKCRECIIHCDIKPENILLDAEFCPKVADFGLAKLVGRDFSRVLTTIRGTRGYLAPEWISGVAITAKADVYSYGMMLFELVSGRRNTQQTTEGKADFFPTWSTIKLIQGEDVLTILDPRLEGIAEAGELMRVCKLACWCVQEEENQRPSAGQVVQVLEGLLDIDMPSLPRSLKMFADDEASALFFSELSFGQGLTDGSTTYTSAMSSGTQGTSSKASSNSQFHG